jgi:hypothetical protein
MVLHPPVELAHVLSKFVSPEMKLPETPFFTHNVPKLRIAAADNVRFAHKPTGTQKASYLRLSEAQVLLATTENHNCQKLDGLVATGINPREAISYRIGIVSYFCFI